MKIRDLEEAVKNHTRNIKMSESIVLINEDRTQYCVIREGKYFVGPFKGQGRIDLPTHGRGKRHGHHDDKHGHRISVVNDDGTSSHGWIGKLDKGFADTLRNKHGFKIAKNNIVECLELNEQTQLLLG